MNKRIPLLLFLTLSIPALSFGKTLIVSDIDDTIKISHINDKSESISYAFKTNSRFKGMSELYMWLLNNFPESQIKYLTNSPKYIMKKSHLEFLKRGRFPKGEVIFRIKEDPKIHKTKNLRRIIKREKPDLVILFGDNSSYDIDSYNQIAHEFSHISFLQFIHTLYNGKNTSKLKDGQVGFVTPIEILLELNKLDYGEKESLLDLIQHIALEILHEVDTKKYSPMFFPRWINCSQFQWLWSYPSRMRDLIRHTKAKIAHVCDIEL